MNSYPYCLVKSISGNCDSFEPVYTGNFTQDTSRNPSKLKTEFAAYKKDDLLFIRIKCADYHPDQPEYFRLVFDPARSARRPHNLLQVRIHSDGRCNAGKMEYDIVHLKPVDGIFANIEKGDSTLDITVTVPLLLLHPQGKPEAIGFNMYRSARGELAKWSGYPSELCIHTLQGCGDLIFTDGLSDKEVDELVKKITEDRNLYHTRWEKQSIPQELYRYYRPKKSGFSLRIKKSDVESARYNAEHTLWGKATKDHIFEVADYWASKSDDELFDLVPVGNPRALTPSQFFGDPLTGGNRGTLTTCLETPYRWYNQKTKEWWYPGKKVVNPLTKEEIIVEDNGEGFLLPEGFANPNTRCMLVAAYRSFILGMLMSKPYCPVITDTNVVPNTSGLRYAGAIPHLAYAYVLSDDIRYAYKAAILIGRIAELYPYMNGGYHDGSYSDTVHILEPSTTGTEWKKSFFEAYDLIFDGIDQFHDKLQEFFNGKPDPLSKKRETPFDLKQTVEKEMIPYVIYSCELERSSASDWSMRLLELELIVAGLIQNGELLHRILFDSKFSFFSKLINSYYRDGKYAYDSSSYVEGMSIAMMGYADWIYLFQDDEYFKEPLNLFEDKRFSLSEGIMFYYRYKCGALSAAVGDTPADNLSPLSDERKRGLIPYVSESEMLYRRMPSMRKLIGPALAVYTEEELNKHRAQIGRGSWILSIFPLLAHGLSKEELEPYRTNNIQIQSSYLAEDSEISILRSGTAPSNCKHLMLYGQPTLPHQHGDKLGLWLGAYGTHLLAFGGHYPFIWIGPKISGWETHSASCNVVLIDGKNQSSSSSIQREHYEGQAFQLAGMENKEAYPGSHYERWSMLATAPDGENAYVLDRFMVSGGKTFDYNTHGLDVGIDQVLFHGKHDWTLLKGTLAGEGVPLYGQPGYGWMQAIRKTNIKGTITWEYPYENCSLKITSLDNGNKRELYYCLGEKGGYEMKKSPWDSYVLIRDENENDPSRKAMFTTIMEPYQGQPFIRSILSMERIQNSPCIAAGFAPTGIEIVYTDDIHRDIILCSPEGYPACFKDSSGILHTSDAVALLIRYEGDKIVYYEAIGYTLIQSGDLELTAISPVWEGTVEDVSLKERKITVSFNGEAPKDSDIANRVGFITSDRYKKPSPYYLRDVKIDGEKMVFHTDITLIRGEEGWKGSEKALVQQGKASVEFEGLKVLADVIPSDRFYIRNRIKSV
jgi:hypothetical protein